MEIINALSVNSIIGGLVGLFVLLSSIVQVSPLKLNPWDSMLSWIGKKVNREIEAKFDTLQKQVTSMWVNSHRNTILRIARECRAGTNHSPDEWLNVLNIAEEYEKYVKEHEITNGIITQETLFLRNLYQDLCHKHQI